MYLLILFVPLFWLALATPLKYLLYFLLGIYTNDNYELICRSFERISMKEIILLSGLILGLPFFSMFLVAIKDAAPNSQI